MEGIDTKSIMPNIVETIALTKRFSALENYRALLRFRRQEEIVAVDSVTLQVGTGELFGLLGPNGAGKTTLVKMLCTLILPSEGRAFIAGRDVVAEAAVVKPLIGLVDTQERSFFWRLSGRQNLDFFAALYGLRGARARARIDELFDLLQLSDHADRRVMSYSSGMRQKLAVARGLLASPQVLFMDEPTRSLDPISARDLRSFIRETLVEKLGCTVVLVTHHLEEAEALCDRVAIMNHGRIIACGPVAEIKQRLVARHRYRLQMQHLPPAALDDLRAIPGVVQLKWANGKPHTLNLDLILAGERETLPPVMRYIVGQGGEIQRCQTHELSLEEVFVHLVGEKKHGA